nr:hypothetical protein GCM10020093_104750 [Planobispora longispora]
MLDRFRLDGKVAIVTGASSGLGVAFARGLAEAGADIVIGARRKDRLEETRALVEETGRRCVALATDVTRPEDCQALVEAAVAELGAVDVLINNAGVGTAVPALKETPEQFRQVVDINLHGTYWMAQACARVMRPGSSIVNIGSILGRPRRACRRPPTAPPRPRSSASPATWPSSGPRGAASGSTAWSRASSPRR